MQQKATFSFWQYSIEQALLFTTSTKEGISDAEAGQRIKKYGLNSLRKKVNINGVLLFLNQFKTPVTLLLIGAAILSMLLGDSTDSIIIFVIILISSFLGFWQEKGAAEAVKELNKLIQVKCNVVRSNQSKEIFAEDLVPGDIVLFSAGDIVPADCLLINAKELFADEAAFTGETFPVEKEPGILPEDTPLNKRVNALFMGSHIISGKGSALVMRTGHQTLFGNISASLQTKAPETAFEHGITQFGYLLMRITLLLVLVIFAINVYLHKPVLNSFLFSLALAVGLTPQLLPVIISVNLARGAKKMAAKKVIVKKLSSISNFGSIDILCSDKTGTLTEGKVKIKDTLDSEGNHSNTVAKYAFLNASMQQGFKNPIDEALNQLQIAEAANYILQSEIPYDFIRKRLTVQVTGNNENIVITKGALQSVLEVCSQVQLTDGSTIPITEKRKDLIGIFEDNCSKGYRILGVAVKHAENGHDFTKDEEKEMVFVGFVLLFDQPKPEIFSALGNLKQLGVSLKVITGDSALIAISLLRQIGIKEPVLLTGDMMRKITTAALVQRAPLTDVFAEVEPNQKERIIHALKAGGHVTGFIGDGINDAPALHAADVGISVDTAVDVAEEAADIILLERDLRVLAGGIREGRKTFANTMKYIFMATSANFGNMFSMAGASLFLAFLPLLPTQILLTNLLTDLPEMTIAADRVDAINILKPRRWDISFIKKFMIVFGLLSSVFDYCSFAVLLLLLKADEAVFQTGWFTESVISASLIVLVMRTRLSIFKSLPSKPLLITTACTILAVLILPYTKLSALFGFQKLPLYCYGWLAIIILMYLATAEVVKKWFYLKYASHD
ncbi:MAG: magnesium-translocating P-type ATPase [Agriterribacter sp.]